MEMKFRYGFTYKEVTYGWNDKKLYRLPYFKNKRSYGLKEIPFYVFKTTTVYNIQRTKLTINRLKSITESIRFTIEILDDKSLPF